MKLIAYLTQKNENIYSSRHIKRAIEQNICRVNGAIERFASRKLNVGDKIQFYDENLKGIAPKTFKLDPKRILFEDEDLLVYNKPAGVSSDDEGLGKLFPKYLLVHRLDKETTGVIIFAKTSKIKQLLIESFRAFDVKKEYLAIVDGAPLKDEGQINLPIGKLGNNLWGIVQDNSGKEALTNWKCIKRGKTSSLLECEPKTGRTHQIRIHLKSIGHPILGDFHYTKKYKTKYPATRCLLHANTIHFPHPISRDMITVTAPIPDDFEQAIQIGI